MEAPYLMYKDPKHPEEGYEGYCKDLADLIAKKLGITCESIASRKKRCRVHHAHAGTCVSRCVSF
ncbi:hypothetical protein FOCC_FOCC017088 [Frankliniella occidentalis]|nr:hypothetical protein FOCC_FOCC017088 [Frankliniella occidentalis]